MIYPQSSNNQSKSQKDFQKTFIPSNEPSKKDLNEKMIYKTNIATAKQQMDSLADKRAAKLKSKEGSEVKESYKSDTESDSEGTVDLCSDSNDSTDITENGNKFDKCIKKEEPEDVKPDVKELQDRVIKMEREEKARTALVLHSENIPDQVLKDLKKKDGLKIRKGRTFQKLKEGNTAAWQKGVKDGKEINLNQRAIRNEKDN